MKKLLGTLSVFLISYLLLSGSSYAQETPIEPDIKTQIVQAENDYRAQLDLYRTAYSEYTRTKAVWKSTKTLQAEQEELTAGKNTAIKRDDGMIAYIRWLRIQILQFLSPYDKGAPIAERLLIQSQWFENHKAKVAAVTTISAFDLVMAEYSDPLTVATRESIFSVAQLELKLANLAFFQHQARALYDPVLKILETKTAIPAVAQGFVRINELNSLINTDLVEISNLGSIVKVEDFNQRQFYRIINERLSTLQANQVNLLNYIIELESRYASE